MDMPKWGLQDSASAFAQSAAASLLAYYRYKK